MTRILVAGVHKTITALPCKIAHNAMIFKRKFAQKLVQLTPTIVQHVYLILIVDGVTGSIASEAIQRYLSMVIVKYGNLEIVLQEVIWDS